MVSTTSANAGIRSSYGATSYIFLICCRLLPRSRSASSVFTAVRLRVWMYALKRHLLTPAHTFTCPPWLEPTRYSTPHHNTIQRSTTIGSPLPRRVDYGVQVCPRSLKPWIVCARSNGRPSSQTSALYVTSCGQIQTQTFEVDCLPPVLDGHAERWNCMCM